MSRIGLVEEPNPLGQPEQPVRTMQDRATILEAMGGRRNATPVFVCFGLILLLLIAGSVMMGIGISKAVSNQSDNSCDNSATTAAPKRSKRLVEEHLADDPVTAKPFFLSIVHPHLTADQLKTDFSGTVQQFLDDVSMAFDDENRPIISVLSVTPSKKTSKLSVFLADDISTDTIVGLFGIIYTSQSEMTKDDVVQQVKDSGFTLENAIVGDSLPQNEKDQICTSVDDKPVDNIYVPCENRIVFAIDISRDIEKSVYAAQQRFLIEYVFAGNFNHLERLGIVWFGTKVFGKRFDTLSNEKGLEYVRALIQTQKKTEQPRILVKLFDQLIAQFNKAEYNGVRFIAFVSKLEEVEVTQDLIDKAKTLRDRGSLTLILLGEDVDPTLEKAKKLTNNIIVWNQPLTTEAPNNWNDELWTKGYGCSGDVPATVSTPGTPPTLPTELSTTTVTLEPSIPKPCDGIFIIGMDTGKTMSDLQFKNQKNFVGNTLFSPSIFNFYQRLTIGTYGSGGLAGVEELGFFGSYNDVKGYVSMFDQNTNTSGNLRRFINAVASKEFEKKRPTPETPITVVVFVSKLTESQAHDAYDVAKPLRENGIAISLVGLGQVDPDLMAIVTGDKTRVFQWDAALEKPNDYPKWLGKVVKCPNTNAQDQFFTEQKIVKRSIDEQALALGRGQVTTPKYASPYPCLNGKIIVAFDVSSGLSENDFDTQIRFLANNLFSKKWNHLERLTLVDYFNFVDYYNFSPQQSIDDVLEIVLDVEQQRSQPDLRKLLYTINNWRVEPAPEPIHTVIFVSEIDQKTIDTIKAYVQNLQKKNYDITFVTVGSQLNEALFKQLKTNVITWDVKNSATPYNWNEQFMEAFGCEAPPTYPPGPYPCLNGNIIVSFDSSNVLTESNYQRQVQFLLNDVFNQAWTNLGRLALIDYSNFANTQSYSTFETVQDVHDFISTSQHSNYSPSLYHLFQSIDINNLATKGTQSHAIIFVSTISQKIVDDSQKFVTDLQQKNCQLTFVTLGKSVDVELLKQLSKQIIQWDIDQEAQPVDWSNLFWSAYGCK